MTIKIPEKGLTRVERAKAEEALVEVLRILSHNNDLAQGAQIGTVDYASGLWRIKDLVEAALKPEDE